MPLSYTGKMATSCPIGQSYLFFVFCINVGLNHINLFLLVLLPLFLNWKTQLLLNICYSSFLCLCCYLNWLVVLTSHVWSKSGTLTISKSWMNMAGLSHDKFLGFSAVKSNLKSWLQAYHCKELPTAFHTWEKLFLRWFLKWKFIGLSYSNQETSQVFCPTK
jgi:hypothetical protein